MSDLWWTLQPSQTRRDSGPHEIEMLQTDVMRFMAILGLVLMAIFALVQSLQMGPTDHQPELEDPAQLTQEVERLKKKIHHLKEIQTQQTAQVRKEREQVSRSLQQARQALFEREQQLTALNQQIEQRQRSLVDLHQEIETQNRALSALEKEFAAKRNTLSKQQQIAPEPLTPKPPAQGFNLHFASEEALAFLVRTHQVKLYAMLGKRAWHLEAKPQGNHFQATSMPGQFYEMDPQTVPQDYLLAIKKTITAFDPLRLTWGVILPEQTRSQISRLMSQHSGGNLVIEKNSTVTFVSANR
ncbi:conserved hypothetical protein [Nitrosococcus halophilus Nc 4]|uniref:Uncharacterized protein n=1 Tax=Nitrosococcus halophilus (strain Nc4) TaxID=472759 RepID=D5C1N5_NITHN|nr:hypothetical protein [Nitrosococcus halophilus]ADE14668.1 conserved hypothetical protein [Nitrosococcus halophilus Nc 4]